MKLCILTFYLTLFLSFSANAQMQIQRNTDFCCFDSIAPHSFSTPLGIVQHQDTIQIGYWKDGFFNVEFLNTQNGQIFGSETFSQDTISPPLFYGGSFTELDSGYVFQGCYTDNFGISKMKLIGLNDQFSNIWNRNISLPTFITSPSRIAADATSGNFYFASVSDSLYLYCFSPSGNQVWIKSVNNDSVASINKDLFLLSDSSVIICTQEHLLSSSDLQVHFRKYSKADGHLVQDFTYPDLAGIKHRFYCKNDTITIAFQDELNREIFLKRIDLISGNATPVFASGITDIYGLLTLEQSPDHQFTYVWSNYYFLKMNQSLQLLYSRYIEGESYPGDNASRILFDSSGNPILSISYINNTVANHDLLILRLDHSNGNTIDSLTYNDARNTSDHVMNQYLDVHDNLNVVFANDYDNFVILREEAQLGVLQISIPVASFTSEIVSSNENFANPNPCINTLKVSEKLTAESTYQIIDLCGKIVQTGQLENKEIDVRQLQKGTYLLRIFGKKEDPRSQLFLKLSNE